MRTDTRGARALLTLDRPQIHRPNMTQKVLHTQYATAHSNPAALRFVSVIAPDK